MHAQCIYCWVQLQPSKLAGTYLVRNTSSYLDLSQPRCGVDVEERKGLLDTGTSNYSSEDCILCHPSSWILAQTA